jgi:hypothetical protein
MTNWNYMKEPVTLTPILELQMRFTRLIPMASMSGQPVIISGSGGKPHEKS